MAFILAKPWTHLWWLAHAIFAAGFFLLSYGVVRACQSTGSFITVFSEAEMVAQLAASAAETAAAQRNADNLRRLFAVSPVAVVVADAENSIIFRNQRAEDMGAVTAALPPMLVEVINSRPGGKGVELELASGLWVLASWASITYEDRPVLVVWLTDFTEQKQAEDSLHRVLAEQDGLMLEAQMAANAAEASTKAKSRFLAAASHDIRQPLVPVKLFAELLAEEVHEPGARELVEKMQGALQSLDDLVSRLLDFSRVEAGAVQPRMEAVSLARILGRFEREYADVARAKGVELRVVKTSASVHTDRVLLKDIIRNLLENAIRYTDSGKVLMGCRRHGHTVSLWVCDSGIGISPEKLPFIFDEFYQVANQNRDRSHGLGLGLATVDRLCRLLGHDLKVESQIGSGSIFSVDLPLCNDGEEVPALDGVPLLFAESTSLRVLLVEDDASVREAMLILMVRWGWEVVTAGSCVEALDAINECGTPDVMITDLRLEPEISGLGVIAQVNAACNAVIPAIIVTGDSSHHQLERAQSGQWPVLIKPFSVSSLRDAVVEVVGRAKVQV